MDDDARDLIRRALIEDAAHNDVTTRATVPYGARGRARCVATAPCVVAGLAMFAATFEELDPEVEVRARVTDGTAVRARDVVAEIEGPLGSILSAERTALNFLQHLSGVATLTREFVVAAGGAEIRDTRKTTPGWRSLEKAAVRAGGGTNHRSSLAEAVLIKDNHIVVAGGVGAAVSAAKRAAGWVEVECDTLAQVREALDAGADEVLLDNMDVETLAEAVGIVAGRARTEASGGVTLGTVGAIAATGVNAISVGALTHSAPAADLSLDVEAI